MGSSAKAGRATPKGAVGPVWEADSRRAARGGPGPRLPASGATIGRMERFNVGEKLARVDDHWNPRVVAELNGQEVKVVKLRGEFVWHHHEREDELFLVVRGRMRIDFRDRTVELAEGDGLVVPRGVEHRPVAVEECSVLLFEPASTVNTGNVREARTRETLERI